MISAACPFCNPDPDKVVYHGRLVLGFSDAFPVSVGHTLFIPKRHFADWAEATKEEQIEIFEALAEVRVAITEKHHPDGFNIGVNIGRAAGQTIFHMHLHLIPRYLNDVPDPRGGVRAVIPSKANYLANLARANLTSLPHEKAIIAGSDDDPFLPHLLWHMDKATSVDMAVAFVLRSGVSRIVGHLEDLLSRDGRLRILTGDYLNITDAEALQQLLDLAGNRELKIYETNGLSFHPKSYIFYNPDGTGAAFVGSSNLSESALRSGVEWNYRIVSSRDKSGFGEVVEAFEKLYHAPTVRDVTAEWISSYAKRPRRAGIDTVGAPPQEPPPLIPEPNEIQKEALAALDFTRKQGNTAGLVVLATGLGKTWLSAFDCNRPEYRRVLFVAHREEILNQALATYRRIRPLARLGRFTGEEKDVDADVLFASIQTLGRQRHLEKFARDAFDYIVVDEFHHASAATYKRLINHFTPRILLGLTATPERTDGGNLLALCEENLIYRCDLIRGIEKDLLCPFHYFGVPDEVDYTNIPWRSARFDEEALTNALATQARAANAFEQYQKHGGARTLAFCCSQRHADFMCEYFSSRGVKSAAVHSSPTSAPRATALEMLAKGELQIIFAVDMFNEGLDLPAIDTVLMLRPTESQILWLQQFGRGLRKLRGKHHLTVVDYIGNHRTFLIKPRTLLGLGEHPQELRLALRDLETGKLKLPPGCEVTYDLEAVQILRDLIKLRKGDEVIRAYYEDFKERHGIRPTATEAFHDNYDPRLLRKGFGSWLHFVKAARDLSPEQCLALEAADSFLTHLEVTPMTKSFKMLLLIAMVNLNAFPGETTVDRLVFEVRRMVKKSPVLLKEFETQIDDDRSMVHYLEINPINAWTRGGDDSDAFFEYERPIFRSAFDVRKDLREAFQSLVLEIAEWRLAQYLSRDGRGLDILQTEGQRALELWSPYMRNEIPVMFGFEFNKAIWETGFVARHGHYFLLVTLDKNDLGQSFKYKDRFLSRTLFQWQSQNRTSRDSAHGQALCDPNAHGIHVHLFVRKSKLLHGKAAPFIYCGEVDCESSENDNPITIRWRLRDEVPEFLYESFALSDEVTA